MNAPNTTLPQPRMTRRDSRRVRPLYDSCIAAGQEAAHRGEVGDGRDRDAELGDDGQVDERQHRRLRRG